MTAPAAIPLPHPPPGAPTMRLPPPRQPRPPSRAPQQGTGAERMLLAHAQRLQRQPDAWAALVLHLSRLAPPGPRPHHQRVAHTVLQEHAQRRGGQVYALRNGDLVLLARARLADGGDDPAPLLRRLLRTTTPTPERLVSTWPLDRDDGRLLAYAEDRLGEDAPRPLATERAETQIADAGTLAASVDSVRLAEVLRRQTAALIDPAQATLRPLFREIGLSTAALAARLGPEAAADPFLFRHLAARLDRRVLRGLGAAAGRGGALDPLLAPPIHLNLTLAGVLSADFTGLAATGPLRGIEVQFMEACADPQGFAEAAARIAAAGMALVLDGVTHRSLLLAEPWRLGADLLKLDWSPHLPGLAATDAAEIDAAIARIGPARIVLHRAETEAALLWGLGRGIRRYQGGHVDAMLAAARICTCPGACTLRQCMERASATGAAGRHGCTNPALLDAGGPPA